MKTARPSEVTLQAASWVVQLRTPNRPAHVEQDFADWLRMSPVHVREYLRAIVVWQGLAHPGLDAGLSAEQLVREAAGSELIEMPRFTETTLMTAAPTRPRRVASWCVAGAAALGLMLAFLFPSWHRLAVVDISTDIGEQRSAVLADHSIVELNTQSEIRVAFTATERRVELLRGEAFFDVAKDPARPFIVSTDLATARAVGTHFSVYRTATGTIVTVAEGRVLVRNNETAPSSATAYHAGADELTSGTEAEARPGRPVQMRRANVERSLAWRQRKLIFDGDTLAEVVEQFNRYNSPPLLIVDPQLRGQRISGVFGANEPDSLVDFLVKVDHIAVTRDAQRGIRIGGKAP